MISTVSTLILYITLYSITTLVFIAANNSKSDTKTRRLLILGIIIMSLTACLRGVQVGTDTQDTIMQFYYDQIGRTIQLNGIFDFLNSDILYYLLSNILFFLHLGERSFLFLTELLIVMPIGIVAYKKKESIPIHFTMLIYALLYYQVGFNWIRQSAACSFNLLALVYYQEKKTKSAAFLVLFAVLIHSSAIIGLSLLVFSYGFMRIKNKYIKAIFSFIFIAIFILLLYRWQTIFLFAIQSGILPSRFAGYFRVFSGQTMVEGWFKVGKRTYIDYIIRVLMVVYPLFASRKGISKAELNNVYYYKIVSIVGLVIYSYILFSLHSAYGNRISYTIEYVQILNLAFCCSPHSKKRWRIPLRNIIVAGIIILYNIWLYYVLGWHGTVPFLFRSMF